MSGGPAFDAGIPVLTEVFRDRPPEAAAEAPAEAVPTPRADPVAGAAGLDRALLERRLSGRIIEQLAGRVEAALEQRLRAALQEALEKALAGLAVDIRHGVQRSVEDIVAAALAEELARQFADAPAQRRPPHD